MRQQTRVIALISGMVGLAAYVANALPPLPNSLLVGSSAGLILASVFSEKLGLEFSLHSRAAIAPTTLSQTPPEQWSRVIPKMVTERRIQREKAIEVSLDKFDDLIGRFDASHAMTVDRSPKKVEEAMKSMNDEFPEWEGEGRLRTYVLLKKIADSLGKKNAEAYMEMALGILKLRPNEGAEYSKELLAEKVEKFYLNPENDKAKFVVGTLILMKKGDDEFVKSMVSDAIHLWSEYRFKNLVSDFNVVRLIPYKERLEILDMIEGEIAKARKAGDVGAVLRARQIMDFIVAKRQVS